MKSLLFGLTTVIVFSVATCGQCDVVLDQENIFASGVFDVASGTSSEVGQTFTVGLSGTLDHIDVFMNRIDFGFFQSGDAVLSVYNTAGGLPTGSALATSVVLQADILTTPSFISFDVSPSAVQVSANDILAFGITSTGSKGYGLSVATDNYSRGDAVDRILNIPPDPWQFSTVFTPQGDVRSDHSFRTFVSVPEPSTFAIAVVIAAAFSTARRTRSAAHSI